MTTPTLLSELTRIKVLFQLRAIATVMDLPPSIPTPSHPRQNKDAR